MQAARSVVGGNRPLIFTGQRGASYESSRWLALPAGATTRWSRSRRPARDALNSTVEHAYAKKWKALVQLEWIEERREFVERLKRTSGALLQQQGLAVLDMEVQAMYTDEATGNEVVRLQRQQGKEMEQNHTFGPGDFVLMSSSEDAGWEGLVIDTHRFGMRVQLYESASAGGPDSPRLRAGLRQIRVDQGPNRVAYDRQRQAIQAIDSTPCNPSGELWHMGSEELPFGTHLRDVLTVSEAGPVASQRSALLDLPHHEVPAHPPVGHGDLLSRVFKPAARLLRHLRRVVESLGPSSLITEIEACLPGLNGTQHEAIATALSHRLALIQGPPGTGKTVTSAAMVHFIKRSNRRFTAPVLVCAQSNNAVDKLVEDMLDKGLKVVRLGNPAKISQALHAVTFETLSKKQPAYAGLQSCIREIAGYRTRRRELMDERAARQGDSSSAGREELRRLAKKIRALVSEIARLRKELHYAVVKESEVVCCTCIGAGGVELQGLGFPLLVLDEGSQASEPECLVPLMKGTHQVIIVGDHKQLPPTVKSRKAAEQGLGVSLFDRMTGQQVPSSTLGVQYRAHPKLFEFPNLHYYQGAIQPGITAADRPQLSPPFPPAGPAYRGWRGGTDSPVAFVNVQGQESAGGPGSTSKLNRQEARLVAALCQWMLSTRPGARPDELGVITPYDAQVRLIRSELARLGVVTKSAQAADGTRSGAVQVSSVDGFQGRERRVIIFSAVRSNPARQIGFLQDPRRLNVALTRAKCLLVVVGNQKTLAASNSDWGAWVAYVQEQGLVLQEAEVWAALRARE